MQREEELENAFYSASGEAQAAFGDGGVYMEKYLYPAKHIEMQVLCDHYGNVVCLGGTRMFHSAKKPEAD